MMKPRFSMLLTVITLILIHSVSFADGPLKVVVSIVPQKYFVKNIGKSLVDVSVMVLPGASPATYEPKPRQMIELTKAKIFFAIGVPFETVWLEKFVGVNPRMRIVHTEDGIKKIKMVASHHHDEDHRHGIDDPHIWLSPTLVKVQARNILDALVSMDPKHQEEYTQNYSEFIKEIIALDHQIRLVLFENGKGLGFMVYHPSWGYFAESYGLKQIAIEAEGKDPKAKDLQQIIQHAREENVKAIFIQPQFSAKSAHTIAKAIGCKVLPTDPLAENWSENLLKIAKSFKSSQ